MIMDSNTRSDFTRTASKRVLPITGGSSCEPLAKRVRKEHERSVTHIGIQGPSVRTPWSHVPITFTEKDFKLRDYPHNDAMVITCNIGGYMVHNVLVDNGSAADILIAKAFVQMGFEEKDLRPSTSPLCGFGGRTIDAMGKAILTVCFGQGQNTRAEDIVFDIVDIGYPYNAIIGRATLNAFEAVIHSAYLAMKIPSKFEVITVFGSQEAARRVEGTWVSSKKQVNTIGEVIEQQQEKPVTEKA